MWDPGDQDTVWRLLLHICQGTNDLIYVASNNDRSLVVGAMYDFNRMFDYGVCGAFVLAFAQFCHTDFTATRSGKKLNPVHRNKDPRCGYAYGASALSVNIGSEVQSS